MNIYKKISSICNWDISDKHSNPVINEYCSEFEVDNWLLSNFIFKKIVPIVGIKPYPLDELLLMVAAVCRLKPQYIFEWGTHIGVSARIFYETCNYFTINSIIHSIDLPDSVPHIEHPKENRGMFVKGLNRVVLHRGDGLKTALKIYRKQTVKNNVLFYLDGDHAYKSVKNELTKITKEVLHPNILIHDTFYQSKKSGYNIGPYEAATSILKEYPHKYKMLSTKTGLPGMTLLYSKHAS